MLNQVSADRSRSTVRFRGPREVRLDMECVFDADAEAALLVVVAGLVGHGHARLQRGVATRSGADSLRGAEAGRAGRSEMRVQRATSCTYGGRLVDAEEAADAVTRAVAVVQTVLPQELHGKVAVTG